ncbi:FtsJ-like methyltransferase-domain-containing protein [Hyaloraphidium curvatum]|nr:FtsJ-like methyltransferase-domain-containing protein [Hyaloraphidium curvatum]
MSGWGRRKDRDAFAGSGSNALPVGERRDFSGGRGGDDRDVRDRGYGGYGGRDGYDRRDDRWDRRDDRDDYYRREPRRDDRYYGDRRYGDRHDDRYDDRDRGYGRKRDRDDEGWGGRDHKRPRGPPGAPFDGPPPDELTAQIFPELVPRPEPLPHPPKPEIAWFVGRYEEDDAWLEADGESGMLRATWGEPPSEPDIGEFIDDVDTVKALYDLKSKFTDVPQATFNNARVKSNPWERFGRMGFISRSACKLALLDWEMDLIPTSEAIVDMSRAGREWRWVDLCGGPGGFSEYILYRLSQHYSTAITSSSVKSPPFRVRGFGTTLRHPDSAPSHQFPDFDQQHFHPLARRMLPAFSVHYGADGTGDLTRLANVRGFAGHVMEKTESMGVDLVVADGGFEVARGEENAVEAASFRLILAEALAALMTLRRGGTLVLKTFDCYGAPMAGLVHVLARLFERVHMTKGGLSRPASPERYIIFRGLAREFEGRVVQFLGSVLEKLGEEQGKTEAADKRASEKDAGAADGEGGEPQPEGDASTAPPSTLTDLIPRKLLLAQSPFVDWISTKNLRFAMDQLRACEELWSYVEEPEKPGKGVSDEEIEEMVTRLRIPRDDRR